jgi:hypothetical protein
MIRKLTDGVPTLRDRIVRPYNGIPTLRDRIVRPYNGIPTLRDTIRKLTDGRVCKKEAGFAFSVGKTMLFSNVGSEAVLVYGAATVDALLSPTAIELLSGEEKEITVTQLGAPANRFILMMNKSLLVEAEVEMLFV